MAAEVVKPEALLFAGHTYYPKGGVLDLRMRGTVEECKAWFAANQKVIADGLYICNWAQIVDSATLEIIEAGEADGGPEDEALPVEITWTRSGGRAT